MNDPQLIMDQLAVTTPVVLSGGHSAEREISLKSGRAVVAALKALGKHVQTFDPAEMSLSKFNWPETALAVVMLHGTYGEDGAVQQELEELGIPYTGSGRQASHDAFHKSIAKEIFQKNGLTTPEFECFSIEDVARQGTAVLNNSEFPLVVKPEAQGSSLGVTIVRSQDQLKVAIDDAAMLGQKILIERLIYGEEWTVPILDRQILPPIRITALEGFFDYQAKYQSRETTYEVIPVNQSHASSLVSNLALSACEVLGTSGICRVDLIVDQDGQPWLLEVNTVPGMTESSLVPKAARQLGWEMPELCRQILLSALSNQTKR